MRDICGRYIVRLKEVSTIQICGGLVSIVSDPINTLITAEH